MLTFFSEPLPPKLLISLSNAFWKSTFGVFDVCGDEGSDGEAFFKTLVGVVGLEEADDDTPSFGTFFSLGNTGIGGGGGGGGGGV